MQTVVLSPLGLLLCSVVVLAAGRGGKPGQARGFLSGELLTLSSNCKDFKDNAMHIHNWTQYRAEGGTYYVSSKFSISRPAETISKSTLQLDYCEQRVTKVCEHFQTWRFGRESCTIWYSPVTLWNKFAESIKPRYSCPFVAREYTSSNVSLDQKQLQLVPLRIENQEWTGTINAYDGSGARWICAFMTIKFYRSRHRPGERDKPSPPPPAAQEPT